MADRQGFGRVRVFSALCIGAILTLSTAWPADSLAQTSKTSATTPVSVFKLPQLRQSQAFANALLRAGRHQQAAKLLGALSTAYPEIPTVQFLKAVAAARGKDRDAALAALDAAASAGFPNSGALQAERSFAPFRGTDRFASIVKKVSENAAKPAPAQSRPPAEPAIVRGGEATVAEENTEIDGSTNLLLSKFRFNSKLFAPPGAYKGADREAAAKLNDLVRRGFAAGNTGDLYDNRDRGHSVMKLAEHPQISRTVYSPAAKAAGVDFSFNSSIFFDAPTIGNASLGVTGTFSIARYALDQPRNAGILYLQYRTNQLYVYPTVKDYLDGRTEVFPANNPYVLISRGRSSSDAPFLGAAAVILASFKPDVKTYLIEKKLLMPTLQMVFRYGQATVRSDEDYLRGRTHPVAFSADDINLSRMIEIANGLTVDTIPPLVQLTVLEESKNQPVPPSDDSQDLRGVDYTTPSAIARTVGQSDSEKRFVISAASTVAPNGKKPTFHWSVLEGDPNRIVVRPRNAAGSVAEVVVPWHGRRASRAIPGVETDRIDIAVFARADTQYSAPAIISIYNTPTNRRYPNFSVKGEN